MLAAVARLPAPAAEHMARALALAERGRYTSHPNPRVGALVCVDGQIVGEGAHLRAGEPHAEVFALQAAGARARGADLYVTLEPCSHHGRTPPCVDAVIAAGVRRVICAMADPNPVAAGGAGRLRAAGIAVEIGLLEPEARVLNRGFVARAQRGRPFVTVKLAASLDGRTAMASGESQWITGEQARADAHRRRAQAGAVLAGADTVLADDPRLDARLGPAGARSPDRIVLDTRNRVPAAARAWAPGARRFWIAAALPRELPEGVEPIVVASGADGHLPLPAVLQALAVHEINEVLVEAGPALAGAFLQAGLADELIVYLAPCLLGDAARPLARLPGLERLAQRVELEFADVQRLGGDLCVTLVPRAR